MGIGAVAEPLVVVTLLVCGAWVNRNVAYAFTIGRGRRRASRDIEDVEDPPFSPASFVSGDSLLSTSQPGSPTLPVLKTPCKWRERELKFGSFKTTIHSPDSRQFKDRWWSRVMRKFPFLQEVFYWILIYWVYQLGRAFTAVTLVASTVDVARRHALQVIHLEQALSMFWEIPIQQLFLRHPSMLLWINRIYSFIHIPGTIFFLVYLYYFTTTRNRIMDRKDAIQGTLAGPSLFEARRRTMAMCNLLAFIVFTFWPCMPPRLLSDANVTGPEGIEARSYGFVDTVHGDGGEGSVWTKNKFCNQYAAMPSLHFGYSLLIGLTVATIPLAPEQRRSSTVSLKGTRIGVLIPSWNRIIVVALGLLYPLIILVAIVSTANHFLLDAVAGAIVCGLAWNCNDFLLNLLPLEDVFLWCVGAHFPEKDVLEWTMTSGREEIFEKTMLEH